MTRRLDSGSETTATSSSPINLYEVRQQEQKSRVSRDTAMFVAISLMEIAAGYLKWKHFNNG
jgi:hypothetical protein